MSTADEVARAIDWAQVEVVLLDQLAADPMCSKFSRELRVLEAKHIRTLIAAAGADAKDARLAKYEELIYAVASKFPGESRHETALRYIRRAESHDADKCGQVAAKESP